MHECRISIITAVRNGASCIRRALDSVRSQSGVAIEHIVVDGGSTDGTVDILRERHADFASWTSERDSGISDAFNKGLARATGDIVGILNADDWYEPGALARIATAWSAASPAVIFGASNIHKADGTVDIKQPDVSLLEWEMHLVHPATFIARSSHLRHGGYREDFKIAMDYELLLRLRKAGDSFYRIEGAPLANYSLGGISDRSWVRARIEASRARDLHCPSIVNRPRLYAQLMRGQMRRLIGFDPFPKLRRAKS